MFLESVSSWQSCRRAARAGGEGSSGVTNLPRAPSLGANAVRKDGAGLSNRVWLYKNLIWVRKKAPNHINLQHGVKKPCLCISAGENSGFSFLAAFFLFILRCHMV